MKRHFVAGAAVMLASAPGAVLVTLLLLPVWRWIEARFGIESIGHSGPAEWCYVASYLACASILSAAYVATLRLPSRPEDS